ncbi:MAG: FtsL-like putative cell division protein [Halanaerobium sp.]|nr:FtsL-like putative cell division protein [Halanaerobium sp.]
MIAAKNNERNIYRMNYQARKGEGRTLVKETNPAPGKARSSSLSKKSRSGRFMVFWTILIFFIAGFFILYVGQQVQVAKTQMRLDDMNEVVEELEKENSYLKLQLAERESLDSVEKKAREELGMVQPDEVRYVYVETEQVTEAVKEDGVNRQSRNLFSYLSHGLASFIRNFTVVKAGTMD